MNTAQAAPGVGSTLLGLIAAGLNPLQALWYQFITYLPAVIAAVIVFFIGWAVAVLLGRGISGLLHYLGLDAWVARRGIRERLSMDFGAGFSSLSNVIGSIVKWLMILASIGVAASVAGVPEITNFVNVVFAYIPNVVVAAVILAVGVLAGQYASEFIAAGVDLSGLPVSNRQTLGVIIKYAIITLSVMAALLQLGIVRELIQILFAGLVLALALAFGLGGREHASDAISKMRQQA
jgi:hypothetical protein